MANHPSLVQSSLIHRTSELHFSICVRHTSLKTNPSVNTIMQSNCSADCRPQSHDEITLLHQQRCWRETDIFLCKLCLIQPKWGGTPCKHTHTHAIPMHSQTRRALNKQGNVFIPLRPSLAFHTACRYLHACHQRAAQRPSSPGSLLFPHNGGWME